MHDRPKGSTEVMLKRRGGKEPGSIDLGNREEPQNENAAQDAPEVHSKMTEELLDGHDQTFDLKRLGRIVQMIDASLKFSTCNRNPKNHHKIRADGFGIDRVSTGIALQQIHGYRSFDAGPLAIGSEPSPISPGRWSRKKHTEGLELRRDSGQRSPATSEVVEDVVPGSIHQDSSLSEDVIMNGHHSDMDPLKPSERPDIHDKDPDLPSGISRWQVAVEGAILSDGFKSIGTRCPSRLCVGWILFILVTLRSVLYITIACFMGWGGSTGLITCTVYGCCYFMIGYRQFLKESYGFSLGSPLEMSGAGVQEGKRPAHLTVTLAWLQSWETTQK